MALYVLDAASLAFTTEAPEGILEEWHTVRAYPRYTEVWVYPRYTDGFYCRFVSLQG